MSKQLLYLFGEPGTGKITVARILQERLGWRLFWLHDLDPVCTIVGRYPLPRLMDRISVAVLEELMDAGESIIYVRPSRDRESVAGVLDLAKAAGYGCYPIRLTAPYWTLVERVSSRGSSKFRIGGEEELDRYLDARPSTSACLASTSIYTGHLTPEQVADEVQQHLVNERMTDGKCSRVHARSRGADASQADRVPAGRAAVQP